ncbi:MAG TPA: aldose 1-epimerase family protein [Armatimonadota bacterium]|nr:aldose 1-epimerase family protein [Armatimonadota bacterium]
MPNIFGKDYTKEELRARVGRMDQLCGVRAGMLTDGRAAGVRVADFWNGSGLEFSVLLDRGMDISAARWKGRSLCWRSPVGEVNPAYFDARGMEWLRSFVGGLVVTSGLRNVGSPGEDQGEQLNLHGRIDNLPAENVHVDAEWDADGDYVIWASGKIREARVFGENVLLTRKVFTRLGANKLWIHDTVENQGHQRTEHLLLYHMNIGFPIVDEGSELIAPSREVRPRDAEAEKEKEAYASFHEPRPDYQEKVYYHQMVAGADGIVPVALVQRNAEAGTGFGVYVSYVQKELPQFVQWKMMGQGMYVVGLEPANCLVEGRAQERAAGRLQYLEPGERREYRLEIGVLPSLLEITAFEDRVRQIMEQAG